MEQQYVMAIPCRECLKVTEFTVPTAGYNAWRNGAFIQDALPRLTADQRELLISGTCGPCFDAMFAEDED